MSKQLMLMPNSSGRPNGMVQTMPSLPLTMVTAMETGQGKDSTITSEVNQVTAVTATEVHQVTAVTATKVHKVTAVTATKVHKVTAVTTMKVHQVTAVTAVTTMIDRTATMIQPHL